MDFDYIVVGAGSAGCVLAARLSEDGRATVLLLEAGGHNRRFWLQVPIGYGHSFYNRQVNWMYETEPDAGLGGRRGYWPRGKVLGGSSAINAMVFVRGHPGDFDDWAAAGNPGWSFADVLPYFKKLEDFSGGANEWRGAGGPLRVSDVAGDLHPLNRVFVEAARQMGVAANPDFNGAKLDGAGAYQITTRDGRRMSTARAYLDPARRRANLRIETEAHAGRILFEGRRAIGIEYHRHGEIRRPRARREVILAAGAINTPALLQVSGVGPSELLARHGIAIVHDNPAVGRHLQDHLYIDHVYRTRVPTLNQQLRPLSGKLRAGLRYLLSRRGPLSLSVNQGGAFVRTRDGLARPNLQVYFSPVSYTRVPPGTRAMMSPDPDPGILLFVQPCRPASRGHIEIASADPFDAPRIFPNSLSAPGDLEDLLDGAGFMRALAATPALSAIIERELVPGGGLTSRADMIADVRQRAGTVFHPCGSCRMGPDPATAVVDARLNVHGLEALRIVDASVFPNITSANINAPVIMLAEKASDLVRGHGPTT